MSYQPSLFDVLTLFMPKIDHKTLTNNFSAQIYANGKVKGAKTTV